MLSSSSSSSSSLKGFIGNLTNNNAQLGSAMFFEDICVKFDGNFKVESNSFEIFQDRSQGFGAVTLYRAHIFLYGQTTFANNQKTGLVLDYSYVHLYEKLELDGNVGIEGGGMALYGQSQIIVKDANAQMQVTDNKASKGAGIYVQYSSQFVTAWETNFLPINNCFIRFDVTSIKTRIFFKNNNNESDIFTNSLRPCADSNDLLSFFLNSTDFDFNHNKKAITTDTVRIHLPESPVWENMYAGKITVPIELYDEANNTVSELVKIEIKDTNGVNISLEEGHNYLIPRNNKVQFRLLIGQRPDVNFTLVFSVESVAVPAVERKTTFKYCPFGYFFQGKHVFV